MFKIYIFDAVVHLVADGLDEQGSVDGVSNRERP